MGKYNKDKTMSFHMRISPEDYLILQNLSKKFNCSMSSIITELIQNKYEETSKKGKKSQNC